MRTALLLTATLLLACVSCARSNPASAARNPAPAPPPSRAATPARAQTAGAISSSSSPRRSGLASYHAIDAALERPVIEVSFEDRPLEQCFAWISEQIRTPIRVDWPALQSAGTDPKALVTLRVKDISRRDLLETLLTSYCNGAHVDYAVLDGVVLISATDEIAEQLIVRTYDVTDLLAADRTRLVQCGAASPADADSAAAQRLIWVLQNMAEPRSWNSRENFTGATIFDRTLSVRAPSFTHRAVADFLTAIRRLQLGTASAAWIGRAPDELAAAPRFDQPLPTVTMTDAAWESIVEWLSHCFRPAKITADWDALAEIGIHRESIVTVAAQNISLRELLDLCAREVTASYDEIAYATAGDEFLITTANELGDGPIARVYDVHALLDQAAARRLNLPSHPAPGPSPAPATQPLANGLDQESSPAPLTDDETALLRSIEFMVLPDCWAPEPDGATAECFGGLLFVLGPPALHLRVEDYLRVLSATNEQR